MAAQQKLRHPFGREEEVESSGWRASTTRAPRRSDAIAEFVAATRRRPIPFDIVELAKLALIDHVGVALGGMQEPVSRAARQIAFDWQAPGAARIIAGPRTRAGLAAFANATAAHALDYDDTHADGSGHISAPVWSSALAVASDLKCDEQAALSGFIAGYEVMARLGAGGTRGIGKALQERGLHPTSINGVVGAAAAAASIMRLDAETTAHALGLAATSAGGLVASFGTDAKPYHAGRAAWNGIVAAELAAKGVTAGTDVFELQGGMLAAFIQDGGASIPEISFDYWELRRNGYKPFACCRAAHASIQAAQEISGQTAGRKIAAVRARTHWSAQFTAGNMEPSTTLEAKFSVAYCVAAALLGYDLNLKDFEEPVLSDPTVKDLTRRVQLEPVMDQPQKEATVEVWFDDGGRISASSDCFVGHPDNPMSPEQFVTKFMALAVPTLGTGRAEKLLGTLRNFNRAGSLREYEVLCAGKDNG